MTDEQEPAPEGQTNLAQRFSAGEYGYTIQVPEGRPKTYGSTDSEPRLPNLRRTANHGTCKTQK